MLPAELTRAVERSAAPAAVTTALDRWLERVPDLIDRLDADSDLRTVVVAVLASGRSLTETCLNEPDALEVLSHLDRRRPPEAESVDDLIRRKRLEYLRIAASDLTGREALEGIGAQLATMADDVLASAWMLAGPEAEGLAVIGMGKLGGNELNYASDVDVLFVGEGDVQRLLTTARACFRVDADLRPEGRDGPLVRTLSSYQAYWDRWAQTWEFQSLLKARFVAGNVDAGGAFASAAAEQVWGRTFGAEEIREVRRMKARAEGEIERRGLTDRELKRGRGGIRDIEFAIQLLQLVHGRADPTLRSPTTLTALAELALAGYVDHDDAGRLASAYRCLRALEHRLQLVDGAQVHTLPDEPVALDHLARVMGYRGAPDATATRQLLDDLRDHQAAARAIHEQLFFRPLLELFAGVPVGLTSAAAVERLAAFGFADADQTRLALRELTSGLARSSRMMQQFLPLLLEWLSEAPDPDSGLLGLRRLAALPHRADMLVSTFRDSLEAARRLCLLLGTSRFVGAQLEHHPELIADLAEASMATVPVRDRIEMALAWRGGIQTRLTALRHLEEEEELRIASADILDLRPEGGVEEVGARLTTLAEEILGATLDTLAPPVPLAVIAMGRFGGGELSYASDLDVLLVHDAKAAGDVAAAEATAEAFLRAVKGTTPADRLYLLDADLRPEGKQGPLARSLGGYGAYYQRWAMTWERQALLRARPVAGDAEVAERFMALAGEFVWQPLTDEQERDIRRMKARIERERLPTGDDPDFHLKLGRGSLSDIEWTAQLLQLRHQVASTGTIAALRALVEAGALDPSDGETLVEAYRFCERTRNRLYLVRGAPGDALPSRPDHLTFLARSLGSSPTELRSTYRRVTRRAREVTERLFYGSSLPAPPPVWRPGGRTD
ncbi:MAG TPA: bifunctional [glutamine synthetase] adenylyltransferase/[glutamine synthetase]-adenylyl-L-tyrosine phosphorylase [Acidimicrobiales bacterium]|nr:bifunctional [glutamine synthetase] adenylyltransferase/[glutamine synthetase]-adenylyl-L-tyrosine phosphorylase [Acidimicrobiales bacterium]